MQRKPAVAGQFYPGNTEKLRADLDRLISVKAEKQLVRGIISPHAGYMYSGAIAGKVFGAIKIPATVLVLGPNHHGAGVAVGLYPDGEWLTPLGSAKINANLNSLIQQHVPPAQPDTLSHQFEHSLEVQVPFIQYLRSDVEICAMCLGFGDYSTAEVVGKGLAAAIREFGKEVLIVASSDMTHYESAEIARRKDDLALQRALNLDPQGLLHVCRSERITMCGVIPAAVMLVAAKELGATHSDLIAYGTSGDITGDNRQVVGYASVAIW